MKTAEFVLTLLELVRKYERSERNWCPECRANLEAEEHTPDCRLIRAVRGAEEYLRIMEGSKK